MSTQSEPETEGESEVSTTEEGVPTDPRAYTEGPDRYINFIKYIFRVQPTEVQRRLLRAVSENQRVVAVGGNGPGKSYIAAMLNGAFLYTNPNSICMPTSGTYSVLTDTLWRPLQSTVKETRDWIEDQPELDIPLPGRCLQSPPRIDIRDEWYLKAVSPTHPSNLEGRHAGTMLITIEEADKPDIGMEHIDSAESMVTDENDRMLVIANPPEDEGNCVYELMQDDNWETVQFSSFESRNVQIDMGELEGEKFPGMVDLQTIKTDWERWNKEPWPGAEEARTAHERRDDLDTRWYRRRAGVMPPVGAEAHRPIYVEDVREVTNREYFEPAGGEDALAIAVDVARMGADSTVVAILYPSSYEFMAWNGQGHAENERRILAIVDRVTSPTNRCPLAIDAVGEGSGLADRINESYDESIRFKAGQKAMEEDEYYNRWTEGLVALGQVFEEFDIAIRDEDYREELYAVAREVELEENYRRSGDVLRATSKSVVKERLGRSPDRLDASLMAAWAWHIQDLGPSIESPRITQSY